jgi:hypothetical protein
MIDQFDRFDFESALPVDKNTKQPLWHSLGVINGEWCYTIPVKPGGPQAPLIYVRSSVRFDGQAAGNGEDSIRCWLASDIHGTPLGSKPARWITRVKGWQRRMTEQLRLLYRLGMEIQAQPCPDCSDHVRMHAYRVRKDGPNKGRWFLMCPTCRHWDRWLTEEKAHGTAA